MTRSSDCIILLQYLAVSGQQSLRKMQEDTGIPFATIREYINPTVLARKTWEELEEMRNKGSQYHYYLSTITNPTKEGCQINLSKFKYLEHYGINYGYYVYYSTEKHKIFVEKLPEDQIWNIV